jgi:hypothetical protein
MILQPKWYVRHQGIEGWQSTSSGWVVPCV